MLKRYLTQQYRCCKFEKRILIEICQAICNIMNMPCLYRFAFSHLPLPLFKMSNFSIHINDDDDLMIVEKNWQVHVWQWFEVLNNIVSLLLHLIIYTLHLFIQGMPEFTNQAAAILSPPGREGRVTGVPLHGHGQRVQDAPWCQLHTERNPEMDQSQYKQLYSSEL